MMPQPTALKLLDPARLQITWSDGRAMEYTARLLRDRCPCATCREKRRAPEAAPSPFAILTPAEARPLAIESMRPVGNYAYCIGFSDGHDTGIYTLEFLHELGEQL